MPAIGEKIGEYQLTGMLGKGGFGTVWIANGTRPKREVAIKILHQDLITERVSKSGPTVAERFLTEARLLQKLNHPGFCEIYSVIEDLEQNIVAYAMERLIGSDLSVCADQLTLAELLEVFAKIADTLGYLHRHGIIHRDIKAANIFISSPRGPQSDVKQIKLLDFGIAKELNPEVEQAKTAIGTFLGSVNTMPPESFTRWEDDTEPLGPALDQWSLGVSLYQCLTGKMPFSGATLVELILNIEQQPYALVELLPRFDHPIPPENLLALIDRCLEKNPSRRYPSMQELALAFRSTAQTLGHVESTVMTSADYFDSTFPPGGALNVTPLQDHLAVQQADAATEFSMPAIDDTRPSQSAPIPEIISQIDPIPNTVFQSPPTPRKISETRSPPAVTLKRRPAPRDISSEGLGIRVPAPVETANDRIPDDAPILIARTASQHGPPPQKVAAGVNLTALQFALWLVLTFVLGFLLCYLLFGSPPN